MESIANTTLMVIMDTDRNVAMLPGTEGAKHKWTDAKTKENN